MWLQLGQPENPGTFAAKSGRESVPFSCWGCLVPRSRESLLWGRFCQTDPWRRKNWACLIGSFLISILEGLYKASLKALICSNQYPSSFSTEGWIQDLTHTRQALYHWTISLPFSGFLLFSFFESESKLPRLTSNYTFSPGRPWFSDLPVSVSQASGVAGLYHNFQKILIFQITDDPWLRRLHPDKHIVNWNCI